MALARKVKLLMRVAIFIETYEPYINGVITHVKSLRSALESVGHEVLIVTSDPTAKSHQLKSGVLYCPGISLKKLYGYGFSNPFDLARLRILKEFNPDIIHIHTEFSIGVFGRFVAQRLKKPIVYTMHTMYDDYIYYVAPKGIEKLVKPAAHRYFSDLAKKAAQVTAPSAKVTAYLNRCGVHRTVNVIPNPVNLTDFLIENVDTDAIKRTRQELKLTEDDIAVCFVGRIGKEKSIDILIDNFTKSFKGEKHFKLFIIGHGPDTDIINSLIKKLGMQEQIKLLGRVEHNKLPPYYQACDLYATASLSDTNSISMLEAMAGGLYVAHRNDPLNAGQIITGVNGAMFETAQEMEKLIREVHEMPMDMREERRKRVSAHTRKYGEKEFLALIMNVYNKAINKTDK